MRYFLLSLLLFLFSISKAHSDIKGQIINNLEKTNNYSFKFVQQINKKKETGNCILVFNRKINCRYDNSGKILVTDGKNLVIKSNNSNFPSIYKLENTTFYKLLDKNYLIKQLLSNNLRKDNDRIFFEISYKDIKIKVFFDKKNLYLSGWETTDAYNNSVFTDINIQEVNKIVNNNLFNLKEFY
tara:strand:+ start:267 stop:818 length:552 start_codon:yes stop_codon:yes gene_type:complete